jgi:hypothetical protein
MNIYTIALFGEAEKGEYHTPYLCKNLPQLVDCFGNPPKESLGLYYAVQALLFHRELLFFRVREEGFSLPDYLDAASFLRTQNLIQQIAAFCLPGVSDSEIFEAITPICKVYKSILITSESDFYDYLTMK